MGLNQTYKLLHSKGNHKTDNIRTRRKYLQMMQPTGLNFQNTQPVHLTLTKRQMTQSKMGRRPKQMFLQGRCRDSQETHEKMLNVDSY